MKIKKVIIHYYALLREEAGLNRESVETGAENAVQLYEDLRQRHPFRLSSDFLRVSINDEFVGWQTPLKDGDHVVFIPPVSGGTLNF
ncbi:MAG: hypothetical protein A2Z81_03110 [Omnitrophica WOR_2 bacterium GWA2_45_18]|nr:MAG: hypothetical protein A2Z81_03110 [Omnitrophica WOR_2 bacterium GWA2_45_18]